MAQHPNLLFVFSDRVVVRFNAQLEDWKSAGYKPGGEIIDGSEAWVIEGETIVRVGHVLRNGAVLNDIRVFHQTEFNAVADIVNIRLAIWEDAAWNLFEFERVGGNLPIRVDVRLIAATNKLLEQAVEQGSFREDLFYRLNVVRLALPPLRERRDDIPLLVDYMLRKFAEHDPPVVQPEAMMLLETHDWPGNVRELENAIQRALVMTKGDAILLEDLPPEIFQATDPEATPRSGDDNLASLSAKLFQWARADKTLKIIPAVERELIINALKETNGNQVQAAKLLGITRATLRKRIEKFEIKRELTVE